jgi:hypothetical protein
MTQLLTRQIHEIRSQPESRPTLKSESQLRVAAAMLIHAPAGEIAATTVVGVLGRDDVDAFNALVAEISGDADLDARVRLRAGSFSVRFTRR